MKSRLLLPIFFLSCIILSLHLFALAYFFYWMLWWFDILVHTLGGVLISWIAIVLFEKYKISRIEMILLYGIFGPLLISIGWEIFEFVSGITFLSSQYSLDTTLDMSMGVLGGIIGSTLSVYFFKNFLSDASHV